MTAGTTGAGAGAPGGGSGAGGSGGGGSASPGGGGGSERASDEQRYRAVVALEPDALRPLVSALHDDSWRVRKIAAEKLAHTTSRAETVRALLEVLKERGVPGARNAAAEALVNLGADAEPSVVKLLSDPDADQRKFAAEILGQIGRPSSETVLAHALDDEDVNVRVSAAEALSRVAGDEGRRALERALRQPEQVVRLSALEGLVALRRPPPMPELVALLQQPALQRTAYRALGLIPQPAAVEIICRGLASELRSVREAALSALGLQWVSAAQDRRVELVASVREAIRSIHIGSMQPLVISALESDDLEVKAGALLVASALRDVQLAVPVAEAARDDRLVNEVTWALGKLGGDAGRSLLLGLHALSAPARAAAGEALVDMADPSWVEPLCALLESGEEELSLLAIRALGKTASETAVAPLIRTLREPGLEVASAQALIALGASFRQQVKGALEQALSEAATPAAVSALAKVAGHEALPSLRRTVKDADPAVRAAAAEAACEVGDGDCLEIARLAITDEAPNVRAAAVRALSRLVREEASALLERALSDEEQSVQLAAIDAVGKTGVRALAPRLEAWVSDPDGRRASRAVRALGRMGALSAQVLAVAVAQPDAEVIKEALVHAAGMREGVGAAVALLSHPRWDVRVAAARLLGSSADGQSLPAVQAQLSRETDASAKAALLEAEAQLRDR